jgi:hypothetical protein
MQQLLLECKHKRELLLFLCLSMMMLAARVQEPYDEAKTPRLDRLSPVGTAARVLQLSRLVQVRNNTC